MGIQSWRNLSVLLLAGVALVGCNNGPDKPKEFGNNGGLQQKGLAKGPFQDQWQGNNPQFPVAKQPNNQSPFNQPNPNLNVNQQQPGGLNNAGGFSNVPGGNVPGVGNVPPSFPPIQGGVQPGLRTTQPSNFGTENPAQPTFGPGNGVQPIPVPQNFRQ